MSDSKRSSYNITFSTQGKTILTNAEITNSTISTLLNTNQISTNISVGTVSATTFTGGSLSLSGNLNVAGTLTTVNITSTNLVNTNVSAGVVVASTLLSATGNSNTLGNIFTTGGNVGIGLAAPQFPLQISNANATGGIHVTVSSNKTFGSLMILDRFGGGTMFNVRADGFVTITTSLTTGSVYSTNITSTNIVGTNISAGTLDVNGTIDSTSLTTGAVYSTNITSTNIVGTNISAGVVVASTLLSATGNSNTIGNIFTTGGNVGIGTTSPGASLHVAGSLPITSGNGICSGIDSNGNSGIQINSGTSTSGHAYIDFGYTGNDFQSRILHSNQAKSLQIQVNGSNSPTVFLTSTGNVGIGTTTPAYTLDVNGTIDSTSLTTGAVYSTNITSTNIVGTNISAGTLALSNINVSTATIANLRSTNISTNSIIIDNNNSSMGIQIGVGTGNTTSNLDLYGSFSDGYAIIQAGSTNNNSPNLKIVRHLTTNGTIANFHVYSQTSAFIGGNIGIGTTTPAYTLDVNGTIDSTSLTTGAVYSTNITSTNIVGTNISAGALALSNINVSTATIGSLLNYNQSIIGTLGSFVNLPKLMMYGSGDTNNPLYYFSAYDSNNIGIGFGAYVNTAGSIRMSTTSTSWLLGKNANGLSIVKCDGTVGSAATQDYRVHFATSGNIGIGTTAPGTILDIVSSTPIITIRESGNVSGKVYFGNSSHGVGRNASIGTLTHGNDVTLWTNGFGASIGFATQLTERMRITDGGNVGIGTTTPAYTLDVSGTGRFTTSLTTGAVYSTNITSTNIVGTNISAGTLALSSVNFSTGTIANLTSTNISTTTLSLTSTSNLPINIFSNQSTASFANALQILNTVMSTGSMVNLPIGFANSARNLGYMGYTHITTGSTSNYLSLGLHSVDRILNINGSGNVGIGTTSPSEKLQVVGNIKSTGSIDTDIQFLGQPSDSATGPSFSWTGDTNTGFYRPVADTLGFVTNGAERMRITTGGNVGIGTTAPSGTLSIVGPGSGGTIRIYPNTPRAETNISFHESSTDGSNLWFVGQGSYSNGTNFCIGQTGFGGPMMVFTTAGNIGIGTTAPTHLFSVGIAPNGTTKGSISINTSGESRHHLYNSAGVAEWLFGQKTFSRSDFTFSKLVAGTETDYLTISTGGNVGIGTTAPAYKLQVNGDISFPYGSAIYVGGQVYPKAIESVWQNSQDQLVFYTPGANSNTAKLCLQHNGNVGIGTTSPNMTLDVKGVVGSLTQNITGTLGSYVNAPRLMMYGSGDLTNPLYYFLTYNSELIGTGYGAYINTAGSVRMSTSSTSWLLGKNSLGFGIARCTGTVGSAASVDYPFTILSNGYTAIGGANLGNAVSPLHLSRNNSTVGNITFEPGFTSDGGNAYFTSINVNGYHSAGEQRIGTNKNRWRMYFDQRTGAEAFGIDTWNGATGTTLMTIGSTGNVAVTGSLSKGSGTFDIDHPIVENKKLIHSFIEGPRCDLIYRGKITLINGMASVNIDTDCVHESDCVMTEGTFVSLCANPQFFLQNPNSFNRLRGSISGNILTIICEDNTSTDEVYWQVIAERNDQFIKNWDKTNINGYLITEHDNNNNNLF